MHEATPARLTPADSPYAGQGFTGRHASELRWHFSNGMMAIYPSAVDYVHHGQGLNEFGTPAVYEPVDLDRAAKFGTTDRALYRCTDLAKAALALAYGDEGHYWVGQAAGKLVADRTWAVAALTPAARAAAEAPRDPDFWRAAFPAYGGAPPGGNRARAWVRAFVPRSQRNARDRALALVIRRAAEGLLADAEAQFAHHYDARAEELRAVRRASSRQHLAQAQGLGVPQSRARRPSAVPAAILRS